MPRFPSLILSRLLAVALGFLPLLAAAHPGHYHPPGEDDEFDAVATGLQTLPEWQSILIAAAALGFAAIAFRKKANVAR